MAPAPLPVLIIMIAGFPRQLCFMRDPLNESEMGWSGGHSWQVWELMKSGRPQTERGVQMCYDDSWRSLASVWIILTVLWPAGTHTKTPASSFVLDLWAFCMLSSSKLASLSRWQITLLQPTSWWSNVVYGKRLASWLQSHLIVHILHSDSQVNTG